MDPPGPGIVLHGVLAALTTPFVRGRVSPARFKENLARYETTDLSGYLVLGSTGEAVLLDASERRLLLETARAAIAPDKPMIAGVSAEATRAASEQIRIAADCSADAALVSTPHYFRAEMTHEALVSHFARLADASPMPLLLYNVPKFTGFVLPAETIVALSGHGNIAGIKESSGDLPYLRSLADRLPRDFQIACGAAAVLPRAFAAGARSAILAAAAAVPEPFAAVARAAEQGDASASALHRRLMAAAAVCATPYGVAGIKAAMDLRGWFGGAPRSPLQPLAATARHEVERALSELAEAGLIDDPRH